MFLEGPLSSIEQLRSQLAEDGCSESQVTVAKALLNETSLLGDEESSKGARKNNQELAVFWLHKASEQGSEEALEILKECYDNGIGKYSRCLFNKQYSPSLLVCGPNTLIFPIPRPRKSFYPTHNLMFL